MRRWVPAGAATLVAALVVIALVSGGGGGGSRKPAVRHGPAAPSKVEPIRPRGKRAAVIRRGDGRPDEPAPGTGPLAGIGDEKPETFADPRFRALGVRRMRLTTPWNSIFTEPARLAAWLNAAHAAGLEPLVAFEHERGDACPGSPCSLPPVAAYERAVRGFHQRYPWVRLLQPWNEANSATQPTGTHPARAAAYYEAVRRACPSCVVPAADVLDSANMARWLRRFRRALHGAGPTLWGLHNYSDVNRFRDTGTREFLSLVPGEVWFTETGGIVSFVTAAGRQILPTDENRAARATAFMFQLAGRFARVRRIYIYQWRIDFAGNRFDAGLVRPEGTPRPALEVVEGKRAVLR